MSINDYRHETELVWAKLELIDKFNLFIKSIRDSRYGNAEQSTDDLFYEFFPIWERSGKAKTGPQLEALENRNQAKFVNETIAPIQSKNDHSKKSGKQNIQWFMIWLHAYHPDKAKDWNSIVREYYQRDGSDTETNYRPFEGEPLPFEITDLAKDWGMATGDNPEASSAVSTVRIAFSARDKVLLGVIAFLAGLAGLFWYQDRQSSQQLNEYALAAEAPNFNILYLDVDHLGRGQFDRIRNGETSAPETDELYAKMFALPVVDFNLHQDLRDRMFGSFDQIKQELEENDGTCVIEDDPNELTARTNTLFLVIQSIGGSAAYDVELTMEKISLAGRTIIDGDSQSHPRFLKANDTRGYLVRESLASPDEKSEEITISLGDLLVADGRLVELEAYSYISAKNSYFGDVQPCDYELTPPAYAHNQQIKLSVPAEYVPTTITYKTILGEEITQEIRTPNKMPVLLSRGVIIRG